MKWYFVALALLVQAHPASAGDESVEIRPGTSVTFGSAATCGRLLTARDVFVQAMSPFDRAARLKTDKDVTEAEYLSFVARQGLDWSQSDRARVRPILEAFRAKTKGLDLRFPPVISLLKTTGLEEGRAAYCRGASVVLPADYFAKDPAELEFTIFHELFHIYRRHFADNRRQLCNIIAVDLCLLMLP